jgi:anti-sigma B factor antagonist
MEIRTRLVGGVQVVEVSGSVDAGTAERFEENLLPLAGGEHALVALDMAELAYLSSAGLRILLAAQKAARQEGGEVVLVAMRPAVEEVFSMVGFDALFRSFPTLEQALAALGVSP